MLSGLVREKPNPYPDGSAKESRKQNKNYFYLGMRHGTAKQCSGGGWAVGRPMGSPGRTPTISQK